MIYSDRLKLVREMREKTQTDLANILNIEQSVYSHYETEYNIIPIKHLITLADYLDVSLDYLFNLSENINYINSKKQNNETIGSRLKEFRKDNKITQEKLSKLLNTTHSVISDYERGRYLISTPFLYTICKKYNISADYLLGRIDKPKYLSKKTID